MANVKLGDVARESRETIKTGGSDLPSVGLEHLVPEQIKLTQWDAGKENTFTKAFHKGQILFGRRRAYLKKAALAPIDGICSGDITVIEAIPDKLLPGLMPFIIQNDRFFDFAMEKSAGSLSPRVKWEQLSRFEFKLPPLDRQKELSELLWAANAAKEAYKTLLSRTDELVKSRFIEMFGDPVKNEKGWKTLPMKEFATVKIGPFGSLLHAEDYIENGIPLVNPSHIINGEIIVDPKLTLSTEKFNSLSGYSLQKGDVVLGRRGEIGRCAVVNDGKYLCGTGSMFIRIHRGYLPMILQRILSSDAIRHFLEEKAVGVTMLNLNENIISNTKLPIFSLTLQNQFAAFVEQADKSKFELQKTLDSLEVAYKSLLKENFG
jgi:type I restriction enzyme S subunit